MKFKKIISVILVISIIMSTLTGCHPEIIKSTLNALNTRNYKPYKYQFDQDISNVARVEIVKHDYFTVGFFSVLTLNQETANALLKDISDLYVKKPNFFERWTEDDKVVILVTYENGAAEEFSSYDKHSYDATGSYTSHDIHFVSRTDWYSVVLKHTKSDLPDDLVTYMEDYIEESNGAQLPD